VSNLTSNQQLVLRHIRDFRKKYGIYPKLREIKDDLKFSSLNSIVFLLRGLEAKGYIKRIKGAERGIILVESNNNDIVNVPLVGSVACGLPLLAEENVEGYISVETKLLKGNYGDYFFLRAVGDSMNDADVNGKTIENGDFILIKSQNTANQNEKIVALIDDEATIKILKKDKDFVALVPQSKNPENKPIILHSDFTIQGVVKAVYKKEMLAA